MAVALSLLFVQGVLGALDTLWYHEWKNALPARTPESRLELLLHAARDMVYALLFASLPWLAWTGAWAWVLAALFASEIVVTVVDQATEDRVRRSWGGVAPGERAMHLIMGILYGAFLACFVPVLLDWSGQATGLTAHGVSPPIPHALFALMALGVLLSGLRDAGAAFGVRALQRRLVSPS